MNSSINMKNNRTAVFSIRTKLVLIFAICIVLLVTLISIIIGMQIRRNSMDRFHAEVSRELKHIGNGIQVFFNDTGNTLKMVATHPDVRSADNTINSYVNAEQSTVVKDTVKGNTEKKACYAF